MLRISIILLLLACSFSAYPQKFMDEIASNTCECLEGIESGLDEEERNMQLGLCLFEAAGPYKKQIKKEYKIDLDKIDEDGEKLGRLIGAKLATTCPHALLKLVGGGSDDDKKAEPVVEEVAEVEAKLNKVEGVLVDIATDHFVTFSLKDDMGKTQKYYWLNFVKSDIDLLSQYKMLKDKTIVISYRKKEFFDPRINEYRAYNVIQALDVK